MTKEQIKYYIDNLEKFKSEIEQRLESVPQEEIEEFDDIYYDSEQDFVKAYEICSRFCRDIFDKYNMNLEAFTIILVLDRDDKETIIGKEKTSELLKNIIDIYGEQSSEIIGTDKYNFDISSLDAILDGEDSEKYKEFYTRIAMDRCQKEKTLSGLSDVLLKVKPEILTDEFLEKSLSNISYIYVDAINDLIKKVPTEVLNGNTMKVLLKMTENIEYGELDDIFKLIPSEMYDKDFAMQLLQKANKSVDKVLKNIPNEIKDREVYEFAISKGKWIAYKLPEEPIEGMNDEEYRRWCEDQILGTIDNDSDLNEIMISLPKHLKTERICDEFISMMPENYKYGISKLFDSIPDTQRSMALYEKFIKKSPELIRKIPQNSFVEGVSQEEYDEWAEKVILKSISEITNMKEITYNIPRIRYSEKVWNNLLDKSIELRQERIGIENVPIYNRTIEMYERAMKEVSYTQFGNIAYIDRNLNEVNSGLREEYEKWLSIMTDKQKSEYRKWYEEKVINFIKKNKSNVFGEYQDNGNMFVKIPKEAITIEMIQATLDVLGAKAIEYVPFPSDLTRYNEKYEDIVIYALNQLKTKSFENDSSSADIFSEGYDLLSKIPQEYRTDKVICEAIKKHPKYLNYASEELDNFEELLRFGYEKKLKQQGREDFTKQEIDLVKEFKKNNSNLFATLNIDMLSPQIIQCIGKNSLERIVRYKDIQAFIVNLSKNDDKLRVFGFALENLKEDDIFIEPLIERLSESINYSGKNFIKLVSLKLQEYNKELTDEEKTIISYLASNYSEQINIEKYEDIANFVTNKNRVFDEIISNKDSSLIDVKNAYLERIVGMGYEKALEMVTAYGNDTEQLLEKYNNKELGTLKEKSEKEALEIIIKLKSLIKEKDIDKIKEEYTNAVLKEDSSKSYTRYKQVVLLENSLKRAYGREMTRVLSNHENESNIETIEKTEEGKEYVVRKINGTFNRMVSVMDAYRKNQTIGSMYDKWNTSDMAENHALCYSFINETNPGTALIYNKNDYLKNGVIVSIEGFVPEAIIAVAPYDLCSYSGENTTYTGRQQKYYTSENIANQTRGRYSEYDIELQDMSEGVEEYRKIQPVSIICFETINDDSIRAAIDLSEKLGRTVPIELIDRRELAQRQHNQILDLLEQFKKGKTLQPELVEQIITKFNNIRSAHMGSSLRDEILGERPENENLEAPFNKVHLNEILTQCIEVVNQRIKSGDIQEGLKAITQIKQYINSEREKYSLMPSMYEKQIMSGIDLSIDQKIDRIQRENNLKKTLATNNEIESLSIVENSEDINSITYQELYGRRSNMAEQLLFSEAKKMIDISTIQRAMQDVIQQGYYSENEKYSKEHIARVMMFSSIISKMEGMDNFEQQLLLESIKYYSSGRQLDMKEQHEQYSAEIAGKELRNKYEDRDIGIIQAVIELQNFNSERSLISKQKEEYNVKLEEICVKYGISEQDKIKVDKLTSILKDSVNLDKTRFVEKCKDNCPDEIFYEASLETETASKLIKFSYGVQDELSNHHLEKLERVAYINFESSEVKNEIMKEFFTKIIMCGEEKICSESIINSPIVREMYFKYKFSEIDFSEILKSELLAKTIERTSSDKFENDSEYNLEDLSMTYQEVSITQDDLRKAYEQLSKTKSESKHLQDENAVSEERE